MKKRIWIILAAFLFIMPSMPVAAAGMSQENADKSGEFDCIDGGTVSTQSEGKPKVLVFFNTTCSNCQRTLESIASSDWANNGETDICAIEINGASLSSVTTFRDNHCPGSSIRFGADAASGAVTTAAFQLAFQYYMEINLAGGNLAWPLIAVIDEENKLQYVTTGPKTGDEIGAYLSDLHQAEGGENQPDSTPDTEKPENPGETEQENGETAGLAATENNSGDASCDHEGASVIVSGATATENAVSAYQCVKCGAVYHYEEVANSAFASFLEETADAIRNAAQSEVVIDTKLWVSFNETVFEAMKSRPDVTVTVNYLFEGNACVLTIPAGTDIDSLKDENGYGGFRYIDQVING